jgi:diguanylate cyclase (GGDEF)-like protein
MKQLTPVWSERLALLDIAFQPIVHMHTARLYGVEALLRNVQAAGFPTIFSFFDAAYEDDLLYAVDLELRKKALAKFTQVDGYERVKLFYNLDNRLFEMSDFSTGNTKQIVKDLTLQQENICFEISERHEFRSDHNLEQLIAHYKDENFCVAIDDFGTGYSGYKLLHQFTPDIIKIDRFFLTGIEKDIKKKSMVRSITQLAIQLGIKVIAEGIETKEELLTCKEIGCHFAQGYFVQRPTCEPNEIRLRYSTIKELFRSDKRLGQNPLEKFIQKADTLQCRSNMADILSFFQNDIEREFLPLLNEYDEPMGVIEEREVRQYLYSPFGHALLLNENFQRSKLKYLVKPYACVDINTDVNAIIEMYVQNIGALGVIVTKNAKYYGFLSSRAIVNMINELNLVQARDQNPLTQLPGNKKIDDFMFQALNKDELYIMCYFDLDNFKAFNDVYGFRNGDRVLKLFSELLRKILAHDYFIGHIGGDDFFVATSNHDYEEAIRCMHLVIDSFSHDVKSFYSSEDREKGYIVSENREGAMQHYDLLSVSASVVMLHNRTKKRSLETLNSTLSLQKKIAKSMDTRLCASSLV